MSNLTIRMDPQEKRELMAWAGVRGTSVTDYIKQLVAADMVAGSPEERVAAWYRENESAILAEANYIKENGLPGSHLALNHPWPDAEV
jgi:post-segregation antitoxin (ccd killing protein)